MQQIQLPTVVNLKKSMISIGSNISIVIKTNGKIVIRVLSYDSSRKTIQTTITSMTALWLQINGWSHADRVHFYEEYRRTMTIDHISTSFRRWDFVKDNNLWVTTLKLYLTSLRLEIAHAIIDGHLHVPRESRWQLHHDERSNQQSNPSRTQRIYTLQQVHRRQLSDLKTQHQHALQIKDDIITKLQSTRVDINKLSAARRKEQNRKNAAIRSRNKLSASCVLIPRVDVNHAKRPDMVEIYRTRKCLDCWVSIKCELVCMYNVNWSHVRCSLIMVSDTLNPQTSHIFRSRNTDSRWQCSTSYSWLSETKSFWFFGNNEKQRSGQYEQAIERRRETASPWTNEDGYAP